jgi:alkaline phosphatase D
MAISRRTLLTRAGALGVSATLPGCGDDAGGASGTDGDTEGDDGLPVYEYDGEPGPEDAFQHGVASGDPLHDAVILWTRVTASSEGDIEAFYEVALDPGFSVRVAAAPTVASADRDFTVKVDVTGLDSGTTYYYRFFALGRESVVGRTKTASSGALERLRIGVCSCSSLAHGYFHAYRRLGERADLDLVVHLGDYIYEYGSGEYGSLRDYEPSHEIVSLEDYRGRYAQYRRDADLQEAHRQHPWVAVWDDHELANDAWSGGAENHGIGEGDWSERRAVAERVYREWMPIREADSAVIYRAFTFGDLLSLVMLDTRIIGRDEQATSVQDRELIEDPQRHLLGAEQEAWLERVLTESTAQWRVVGQQVMMAQLQFSADGPIVNADQWDGYAAARDRFFDIVERAAPTNLVVLTGDIHSSWAIDLARDPYGAYDPATGAGTLGVELVTPGVTSPGFIGSLSSIVTGLVAENPHIRWANGSERGYLLLDVTSERVQAAWFHVADVERVDGGTESVAAVLAVGDEQNHLVEEPGPAEPDPEAPPLAPN